MGILEDADAGAVALLHTAHVHFDGTCRGLVLLHEDTLCQHVASLCEARYDVGGLQAQPSGPFEEAPGAVVGVVVPLPLLAEGIVAKDICGGQTLDGDVTLAMRFRVRVIGHAVVAHNGPVVSPPHGLQVRESSQTAEVLLHDGPPLALGVFDEGALMNGVGFAVDELLHEHFFFVFSEDIFRAEYDLTAGPASVGGVDIIIVAFLIEMASLESSAAFYDGLLLLEIEVLVEFANFDFINATCNIHLAVVEEHTGVVVPAREFLLLPRTLRIRGRQQPATCIVAIDENIELAVVILHRASPHTCSISVLVVQQVITVVVSQLGEGVGAIFPVDHIL